MGQKIRLTESQLHNIIRRCVNEAVNELDWKTYSNYQRERMDQANQARQEGDYENEKKYRIKSVRGGNAAGDAMRKTFGYDDIDDFNRQQMDVRYNNTGKYGNQSDAVKQRAHDYNKAAEDYYNGNYEYIKGKGWQLKQ